MAMRAKAVSRLLAGCVLLSWVLGGCGTSNPKPDVLCPGKTSSEEALAAVQAHLDKVIPIWINDTYCRVSYMDEENERKSYRLPSFKIWIEPPHHIYMQGTPMGGPQGRVSMGSNQDEFWVSIKPEDSYWWGKWAEVSEAEQLHISPRIVLEALGLVDLDCEGQWELSNEGVYDILSLVNEANHITKRIFINTSDYLPRKIEYLDADGETVVLVKLGVYKDFIDEFSMPSRIEIANYVDDKVTDNVELTIKEVQTKDYKDSFRKRYFVRQAPTGVANIYRITKEGTFKVE